MKNFEGQCGNPNSKKEGKVRNSSEKKNVEHIVKIESITSSKHISDAFITDIRIERRKRQHRKQVTNNISHHWCNFEFKTSEKGISIQMKNSYAGAVRVSKSFLSYS